MSVEVRTQHSKVCFQRYRDSDLVLAIGLIKWKFALHGGP
jgi:hypothetical protein